MRLGKLFQHQSNEYCCFKFRSDFLLNFLNVSWKTRQVFKGCGLFKKERTRLGGGNIFMS